jgi:perosamine synthetase
MINISEPNITKKDELSVLMAMRSKIVSSFGENSKILERKFSKIQKFKYCLALNSGTSALHLALKVNCVDKDKLVIMPSYTFSATANAVIYCGAQPWFHDVDKNDMMLDIKKVETSLEKNLIYKKNKWVHNKRLKEIGCILIVTSFGKSPDILRLNNIKKKYNIPIIIDAAAGHFAKFNNTFLGKFNFDTIYSFNGNKNITSGSGGAYCTNKKKNFYSAKILSQVGQDKKKYKYSIVGFNYKMNNLQSSLAISQLNRFNKFYKKKKIIFSYYEKYIKLNKYLYKTINYKYQKNCGWLYYVKISNLKIKNSLIKYLKSKNYLLSSFWIPLHAQLPYKNFLKEDLKITNLEFSKILVLPSSTFLNNNIIKDVCSKINKFFASRL